FRKRLRGVCQTTLGNGSHQVETASRSIVFVARDYVSWASLEAQPAVNAGEKFLFFVGKGV
ncbi:MAG TPA: hypothetical protein VIJ87_00880, partial [Pyrinomonadaceae bacterium]